MYIKNRVNLEVEDQIDAAKLIGKYNATLDASRIGILDGVMADSCRQIVCSKALMYLKWQIAVIQ